MKFEGPYTYQISVKEDGGYAVLHESGHKKFKAPVTKRGPKIYVFTHKDKIIYVGQAVQGMAGRMWLGFRANGQGGYWGYSWRHKLDSAALHIWCLTGADEEIEIDTLECVEAELVYLHRKTHDQWPEFQTEIHFHQTTEDHREMAKGIFNYLTR